MRHSNFEILDDPDPSLLQSGLGMVMTLATFSVAASVCSGILTLALMP
jgi:hypothetical protein